MNRPKTHNSVSAFTAKCRLQQSRFRESINEPMGVGPWKTSKNLQISMIKDGEVTGKNFVDRYTFDYAKMRVRKKLKNETIDEYRLFNNLLSSQPMAFNLFCPLRHMLEERMNDAVTLIFSTIFPQFDIAYVTEIELEYLHEDIENYLNDKTAMDVIVRFFDSQNNSCFIAIETKYTDVLGSNSARNKESQKKLIRQLKYFKPEAELALINDEKEISQIYRNFLLSECYRIKENAYESYSLVLSPANHPTTDAEVHSLQDELLPEYQYKIGSITLEQFVETAIELCPKANVEPFLWFGKRYLENI